MDVGRKHPDEVLRHLRRMRRIRYVKLGRTILYPREDVDRLIQSSHVEALGAAQADMATRRQYPYRRKDGPAASEGGDQP